MFASNVVTNISNNFQSKHRSLESVKRIFKIGLVKKSETHEYSTRRFRRRRPQLGLRLRRPENQEFQLLQIIEFQK